MKRYVLKSGEPDGIFPGIGIVTAGEPITPISEDHEQAIKDDGRFEPYTGKKKTAADNGGKEQ